MSDKSGIGLFSDLDIGIRELFRILVPGAYAMELFEWLTPGQCICGGNKLLRIAIWVFIGLIAYGFRVHDKWRPYRIVFEKQRDKLKNAIKQIKEGAEDDDKNYVYLYKYFLETRAPEVKERIHYFTSFYYMLDEMSLISAIAALVLGFTFFRDLNSYSPKSTYLFLVPLVLQLIALFYDYLLNLSKPFKDRLSKWLKEHLPKWFENHRGRFCRFIWIIIVILPFIWNLRLTNKMWPNYSLFDICWQYGALVTAACVFEWLAAKQWKSIIEEQIVLVKDKKIELKKVIDAASNANK